jgi:transketolase
MFVARPVNPKTKESWFTAIRNCIDRGEHPTQTKAIVERARLLNVDGGEHKGGGGAEYGKYITLFEQEHPDELAKVKQPIRLLSQDLQEQVFMLAVQMRSHAERDSDNQTINELSAHLEEAYKENAEMKEQNIKLSAQLEELREQNALEFAALREQISKPELKVQRAS